MKTSVWRQKWNFFSLVKKLCRDISDFVILFFISILIFHLLVQVKYFNLNN